MPQLSLRDAVPLGEIARALVVMLRHHGDVLLASPVFSVLRAHSPRLEIDALVYDDTREMLALHPAIATVHTVGRGWRAASAPARLVHEARLLRALRARRYDLLVNLTEHPRGRRYRCVKLLRHSRPRCACSGATDQRGASRRASHAPRGCSVRLTRRS